MKLSVVALFAAGAMAAVVPGGDSYGEEAPAPASSAPAQGGDYAAPSETPAQSESPEAPEGGSYGEEEQPAPTSAPAEEESPEQPSTVLDTEVVATVTDCGPEVTNCAAEDNVTSTVEVTTSICETESEQPTEAPTEAPSSAAPSYSEAPSAPESESPQPTSSEEECEEETSAPAPAPEQPTYSEAPSAPLSTGDSSPEQPTSSVCVPETNVKTITTEYTTVVPTTILETETVPCPEPTAEEESPEGPTGGSAAPTEEGSYPEASPSPSAAGNETASPEESQPVTAGAGAVAGSVFTALVAGVAAFAFA